jgi:putative transcription factor
MQQMRNVPANTSFE